MEHISYEDLRAACEKLTVRLADGADMPRLGQGTWKMGEIPSKRDAEIEALRRGIECGMGLIDTAEMYGSGSSESMIGEAIRGIPREKLFLVSKVYPHNAGRRNMQKSCEASLKRMGVQTLDLYLLHWRGNIPLAETVECMEKLVAQGLIRRWGVSNFDTEDMEELWSVHGGENCVVNQVLYHLGSRGIEYSLLPWLQAHGVAMMAYCPIAQGGRLRSGLLQNASVLETAEAHGATPLQVLLAFLLKKSNVVAIPKASTAQHTEENAAAALVRLTDGEWKKLSDAFPAPSRKTYLDIL